jgi:hypothetical protein
MVAKKSSMLGEASQEADEEASGNVDPQGLVREWVSQ